jgi:hypothetical protein
MTPEGKATWDDIHSRAVDHGPGAEAVTHLVFLLHVRARRYEDKYSLDVIDCIKAVQDHLLLEAMHDEFAPEYTAVFSQFYDLRQKLTTGTFDMSPKFETADMQRRARGLLRAGPCKKHPDKGKQDVIFCPFHEAANEAYVLCTCCDECYESCRLDS